MRASAQVELRRFHGWRKIAGMIPASAWFNAHRDRIAELAAQSGLPAIYESRDYMDAGGLMSYGQNLAALFRRAATYVHKILKGARPDSLPWEQPAQFELVINLKTAKVLGLTIPPFLPSHP